jgi:hypothetical protein
MLSNIWVWDPESGKNLFRIPDPGGHKGTGSADPGSGSATLDSRVHKTTYAPMIYTALRVRFLMWADRLRGEGGWVGARNLEFCGLQIARAAHPPSQRKLSARIKNLTHGAV